MTNPKMLAIGRLFSPIRRSDRRHALQASDMVRDEPTIDVIGKAVGMLDIHFIRFRALNFHSTARAFHPESMEGDE